MREDAVKPCPRCHGSGTVWGWRKGGCHAESFPCPRCGVDPVMRVLAFGFIVVVGAILLVVAYLVMAPNLAPLPEVVR
jgi:hypothetical protein